MTIRKIEPNPEALSTGTLLARIREDLATVLARGARSEAYAIVQGEFEDDQLKTMSNGALAARAQAMSANTGALCD